MSPICWSDRFVLLEVAAPSSLVATPLDSFLVRSWRLSLPPAAERRRRTSLEAAAEAWHCSASSSDPTRTSEDVAVCIPGTIVGFVVRRGGGVVPKVHRISKAVGGYFVLSGGAGKFPAHATAQALVPVLQGLAKKPLPLPSPHLNHGRPVDPAANNQDDEQSPSKPCNRSSLCVAMQVICRPGPFFFSGCHHSSICKCVVIDLQPAGDGRCNRSSKVAMMSSKWEIDHNDW